MSRKDAAHKVGYIYIAKVDDLIKVGYSQNPGSRVKALRGELLFCAQGNRAMEKAALLWMASRYGEPKNGAEWFDVPQDFKPPTHLGDSLDLDLANGIKCDRGTKTLFISDPIHAVLKQYCDDTGMTLRVAVERAIISTYQKRRT